MPQAAWPISRATPSASGCNFEYLNVNVDPNLFNKTFLSNLALGKKTIDGANYLVKALYDSGFKLYIATNGITKVQQNRLSGQEFIKYITDIFVSEDLKAQKPSKLFFENASKKTGLIFNHQTTLIIGDSLTSDILGGNNAGIDTMWFNPNNLENTIGVKINYIVKSLYEIPNILIK